ncbi:methyltransferase [Nitrospirillum iridis]|uniref:SAM-dependent methyltransferase n=1 Tax=Nitrospirillum iridis TaxID=765888 RepID=A0A7X0B1T5_9PROT|nr:methyltransferase [Nitrospirillum iridis]MBB6254208.1 SAM-dependent methyltransferase [Nitrospirillum iridis]
MPLLQPAPPPPPVSATTRLLWTPWTVAKRAVLRRRLGRAVFEKIRGRSFVVWPGVFNPVVFRTGQFLAEFIAISPLLEPAAEGATALDMGTGCGVLAIFAALRGYRVTAVDVVPEAVSCARANAILNRVAVDLHQGDLFAPVAGRAFDVVLFSLPKFRGTPTTTFEQSWRSPDVIDRLAAELPAMLKPGGKAYFVLTSHGDCAGMLNGLAQSGLVVERVLWRHFGVETLAIYSAALPNRSSRAVVST